MQMDTERGLIYVVAEYEAEEMALNEGFYYAWFSYKLGAKVYTKILDKVGHSRHFAIVK